MAHSATILFLMVFKINIDDDMIQSTADFACATAILTLFVSQFSIMMYHWYPQVMGMKKVMLSRVVVGFIVVVLWFVAASKVIDMAIVLGSAVTSYADQYDPEDQRLVELAQAYGASIVCSAYSIMEIGVSIFLLRWSFKEYAFDEDRQLSLDPTVMRSDDPVSQDTSKAIDLQEVSLDDPQSVVVVEAYPVTDDETAPTRSKAMSMSASPI